MKAHIGQRGPEKVFLEKEDFITHIHGMGLSRSGKSRLIEFICRQLIAKGKPFMVGDPNRELYQAILQYCAYLDLPNVIPFDPSSKNRIIGFNRFVSEYEDESRLMTRAERLLLLLLRVWGAENPNEYSRIERWLRAFFYVLLEQKLSIQALDCFIYWELKQERKTLIERIRNRSIRLQLEDGYSSEMRFRNEIQSTQNKLQKLIHPQMVRIMGLRENNLNLNEVIEGKSILLCNLQAAEDELIGTDNVRVIGTFLVSELWEAFKNRTVPQEFYLILDECHYFLGPDVRQMLTEAAKRGLHLILFHQEQGQIKEIEGAMKNAQTKIFFTQEEDPKRQRCFTLRRADHSSISAEVPKVVPFYVPPEKLEKYIADRTANYLTLQEVDSLLDRPQNEKKDDLDPYE